MRHLWAEPSRQREQQVQMPWGGHILVGSRIFRGQRLRRGTEERQRVDGVGRQRHRCPKRKPHRVGCGRGVAEKAGR